MILRACAAYERPWAPGEMVALTTLEVDVGVRSKLTFQCDRSSEFEKFSTDLLGEGKAVSNKW